MGKRYTVHVDNDTADQIDLLVESGRADSRSEAIKILMGQQSHQTWLRRWIRRLAEWFGVGGLILLGVFFWTPIDVRVFVTIPISASLALWLLDGAIAQYEPQLSRSVSTRFGGVLR